MSGRKTPVKSFINNIIEIEPEPRPLAITTPRHHRRAVGPSTSQKIRSVYEQTTENLPLPERTRLADEMTQALPLIKHGAKVASQKAKSKETTTRLMGLHREQLTSAWGSLDAAFPPQFRPSSLESMQSLGKNQLSKLATITRHAQAIHQDLPSLWEPGGWLFEAASKTDPDSPMLTDALLTQTIRELGLGGRKPPQLRTMPVMSSAAGNLDPSDDDDDEDEPILARPIVARTSRKQDGSFAYRRHLSASRERCRKVEPSIEARSGRKLSFPDQEEVDDLEAAVMATHEDADLSLFHDAADLDSDYDIESLPSEVDEHLDGNDFSYGNDDSDDEEYRPSEGRGTAEMVNERQDANPITPTDDPETARRAPLAAAMFGDAVLATRSARKYQPRAADQETLQRALNQIKSDEWLTDDVLVALIHLVAQSATTPDFFIADTNLLRLITPEFTPPWISKYAAALLSSTVVLFPIHHQGMGHWSLAVLYLHAGATPEIHHYDSLPSQASDAWVQDRLTAVWRSINSEEKGDAARRPPIRFTRMDCAKQQDGFSCGHHTVWNLREMLWGRVPSMTLTPIFEMRSVFEDLIRAAITPATSTKPSILKRPMSTMPAAEMQLQHPPKHVRLDSSLGGSDDDHFGRLSKAWRTFQTHAQEDKPGAAAEALHRHLGMLEEARAELTSTEAGLERLVQRQRQAVLQQFLDAAGGLPELDSSIPSWLELVNKANSVRVSLAASSDGGSEAVPTVEETIQQHREADKKVRDLRRECLDLERRTAVLRADVEQQEAMGRIAKDLEVISRIATQKTMDKATNDTK